jgi:hypothetical protein
LCTLFIVTDDNSDEGYDDHMPVDIKSNHSFGQLNAAAAAAAAASNSSSGGRVFSKHSSADFSRVQASYTVTASGGSGSAGAGHCDTSLSYEAQYDNGNNTHYSSSSSSNGYSCNSNNGYDSSSSASSYYGQQFGNGVA